MPQHLSNGNAVRSVSPTFRVRIPGITEYLVTKSQSHTKRNFAKSGAPIPSRLPPFFFPLSVVVVVAWPGLALHGVAWRGMAWHGVARRGVTLCVITGVNREAGWACGVWGFSLGGYPGVGGTVYLGWRRAWAGMVRHDVIRNDHQ